MTDPKLRTDGFPFEAYEIGAAVVSPPRMITETDILDFGRFTNDMRGVFGRQGPRSLPMPPLHVFSLGLCLLLNGGPIPYIPQSFVAFLGFSSIEFLGDVVLGDVIQSHATVAELEGRTTTGAIGWDHRILKGESEIVIASRHTILVNKASQGV